MTFNKEYILREIAGETLLVRQGRGGVDMTHVVALNPSGAYLYNRFKSKDFTAEDLASALSEEYDIDPGKAKQDAREWLKTLKDYNAVN